MGKKILVIEDDVSLKPFWEVVVKRNFVGCEMIWTVSGEDAVRLIKILHESHEEIGAIFVDLFLSGNLTGFDVLAEVQKSIENVPTVIVSASDEESLSNEVKNVCPNAKVIIKPFDLVRMERIISHLIM